MKLKLTVLLISVSSLFPIQNSQALNSVFSVDGINVWTAGNNGSVMHSLNGGISWSNITIGSSNLNSIFISGTYIWIVSESGTVYRTNNNGVSWDSVTSFTAVKSIYFLNSSSGYFCTGTGQIYRTTNSGTNWSSVSSGTSNGLNSIKFFDNDNGAACGKNGTVVITSNGGLNWQVSATPVNKELLSIGIKSSVLICSGLDATVIKSTNNGSSWSVIDYKIITKSDVNSVFMTDINTYYSVGGGGFIRKSSDAGQNFIFQVNPMLARLDDIYFYNNNTGWACGKDNNVVLSTADGGNIWSMPAGTQQSFAWIRFLSVQYYTSSGNVFALNLFNKNEIFFTANPSGISQKVYRSLNQGINWSVISTIPYGSNTHAFIISPGDSNKFLVLADSLLNVPPYHRSKILRSTDYGLTWTVTFTGYADPDGTSMSMDPNHTDTIYMAPTDSLFYRSTDFGLTWNATGPTVLGKACSIEVLKNNSNTIFCSVAGDSIRSAILYKTTNYASSWFIADSLHGSEELPEIASTLFEPNSLLSTFIGATGGVRKSTNLGITWSNINSDAGAWGLDIARDDPNVFGYGTWGSPPGKYFTVNGGQSFTQIANNDQNFALFFYNRSTILSQDLFGFFRLIKSYVVPIGIHAISTEIPKSFSLYQNYPNPFNPNTKIKFDILARAVTQISNLWNTQLKIYNILGQQVTTLINENLKPGTYEISWDASNYPTGVYYYQLKVGNFSETKKLVLIK